MIQTANGQQIIVQNVGQGGGSVQLAGGETLQQIQVAVPLCSVFSIPDLGSKSHQIPIRNKEFKLLSSHKYDPICFTHPGSRCQKGTGSTTLALCGTVYHVRTGAKSTGADF